ncbi:MAG: GH25 family lysozyme [Eubacteriales bacterium]
MKKFGEEQDAELYDYEEARIQMDEVELESDELADNALSLEELESEKLELDELELDELELDELNLEELGLVDQEEEYFEDEDGNLYSKNEYGLDEEGELYALDDYFQDEDGNLYAKDEYVLGEDGLLYTIEEYEAGEIEGLDPLAAEGEAEEDGMVIRDENGNFFQRLKDKVLEMHKMDLAIAITALAVLIVGIITLVSWRTEVTVDKQVDAMATIGQQLVATTELDAGNLVALKDAYVTRINSIPTEEESNPDAIEVTVNFTSVEKDLKVKFTNTETDDLVTGVLFQVELTNSSGDTLTLSDDNRDGIIYETDMSPGTYDAICLNVGAFEFPQTATSVVVKDLIEYEKIYIADEVKTEADVDVSVEDATVENTVVEATLADTVEFVESTQSAITGDALYTAIDKSTITNPGSVASRLGVFLAMSETTDTVTETDTIKVTNIALSVVDDTMTVGNTQTITATVAPENASDSSIIWSASPTSTADIDEEGKVTASAAGTVTITATANDASGVMATVDITVTEAEVEPCVTDLTLSPTSLSIGTLGTGTSTATVAVTGEASTDVTAVSADTGIATVVISGSTITVTGVKAGSTTITVTTTGTDSTGACITASLDVTVTDATAITLSDTSLALQVGNTHQLTPTITGTTSTATYTSSNDSVATVDSSGNISAKGIGTATITVTVDSVSVTCTVTVSSNPSLDTTTLLKDVNGVQVYVKDGSTYREAVYADYYTYSAFYLKSATQYKYTGWQTISNITYYYDKNGNVVTGEQVIQGVKYYFASDGALSMGTGTFGIDVSKWNGTINWTAVKNAGVSYVIIRCGYRGYTSGTLIEDPNFKSNIEGAIAAGIKVGVYFYSQAINEVEAVEEASMVLDMISGYRITYPVFIDIEKSGGRADSISVDTRTAVANAFCATIQNNGYSAGVYANKDWFTNMINASQLSAYKIWLAQYNTQTTYSGRYDMWQYSDSGTVGGISGNVDLNESYLGY